MDKSTNKRSRIIEAAIRLFVKNGVHGTSMNALAKAAEVATGSLYTYFDSKDALIVGAFESIIEEIIEYVDENNDAALSVKARFYHLLEQQMRFYIAYPDKFRFMMIAAHDPVILQLCQEDDCEDSPLGKLLTEGKNDNLIKDIPLNGLYYQIFGGMESFLGWLLFSKPAVTNDDVKDIIDMAWDAIKR